MDRSKGRWRWCVAGDSTLLQEYLPADQSGVATALLLGEGSAMTQRDWEKYIRTGVIHVLVISGQHVFLLACFLWWIPRLIGIRRRWAAGFIALFLVAYALSDRRAAAGDAGCRDILRHGRRRDSGSADFAGELIGPGRACDRLS